MQVSRLLTRIFRDLRERASGSARRRSRPRASMTSLWLDQARPSRRPAARRPQSTTSSSAPASPVSSPRCCSPGRDGASPWSRPARSGRSPPATPRPRSRCCRGRKYSRLLHYQSQRVAGAYVDANREGMEWLLRFCDDHGVAGAATGRRHVRRGRVGAVDAVGDEHDAAASLGLDVAWQDSLDVPFPRYGAARCSTTRRSSTRWTCSPPWWTSCARTAAPCTRGIACARVSLTGEPAGQPRRRQRRYGPSTSCSRPASPILDRGLYFAKVEPQRSYAPGLRRCGRPAGMYLSAGSDSPVGPRRARQRRRDSRCSSAEPGTRWAAPRRSSRTSTGCASGRSEYFPGAVETHQWSAQDYRLARRRAVRRPAAPRRSAGSTSPPASTSGA